MKLFCALCKLVIDLACVHCINEAMDTPLPTPAEIYAPDIDDLINWEALAEYDTGDIREMVPLIVARLIQLL